MINETTLVMVPCLSGAPWDLEALTPLHDRPMRTFQLPSEADLEGTVTFVRDQVADLGSYVLVGDSFGALVSLALAVRRPPGLRGLVISGGFASRPIADPLLRLKVRAAAVLPGVLYRRITLRMHANALASPFDAEGEVVWTEADSRALFERYTPWKSYVMRTRASLDAEVAKDLGRIDVPTLILTPSDDRLIGSAAARELLEGIPDSVEQVLPRTGHMFRFTHPKRYASEIATFLRGRVDGARKSNRERAEYR